MAVTTWIWFLSRLGRAVGLMSRRRPEAATGVGGASIGMTT